jgi:gliding motility-associated lipoprotein GldH
MKTIYFFLVILVFVSCDTSSVYSKRDTDFKNNQWQKTDSRTYDFTIADDTKLYDIEFNFGHVYDYQFDAVPITIKMVNPSGEVETIPFNLQLKDKKGKDLGDCSGDICDVKKVVKEKVKLTKGKYKIMISHTFKHTYLPNILSVGIDVNVVE